jgi:hypothetical protein
MAGSIALVGFGFDSLIEVTSGAALLWRLHSDADESRRERVEAVTLRIVGVCFLLLAAYVSFDSIKSLSWREQPRESIPGYRPGYRISNRHAIAGLIEEKGSAGHKERRPDG